MRISDWSSDVCSSDLLDVDFVEYRLGRGRIGASFGHDGKGESGGQDAGIQDEQLVDFHGMSPLAGARTVGRYRSRRSVARDRIGCWTPRIRTATGRDPVSSGRSEERREGKEGVS